MNTKEKKIMDYSQVLADKYGQHGTKKREKFQEKAMAFYTGQLIEQARKDMKMTQEDLALKIGADKSYISRIENGKTEPKISTFYKIVEALGLKVNLIPAY